MACFTLSVALVAMLCGGSMGSPMETPRYATYDRERAKITQIVDGLSLQFRIMRYPVVSYRLLHNHTQNLNLKAMLHAAWF